MKKNDVHWFWGLAAYIALGLFGFMLYPSMMHIRTLVSVSFACVVIDGITFFIGCGLLRKFKEFSFGKVMIYLVLIIAPSAIFSSITTDLSRNFIIARDNFFILWPGLRPDPQLFLFFCAFIVFVSLNFALWRALFNVTIRQAFWVSIPAGLINTITYLAVTPVFK